MSPFDHHSVTAVAAGLTVMRSTDGKRLAKTIGADGSTLSGHDRGWSFDFTRHEVETVEDLADFLVRISGDPYAGVALGTPLVARGRRISKPKDGGRTPPSLATDLSRVFPIDIDRVPLPPGLRATAETLEEVARYIRSQLPEPFRTVACVVNATASYGAKAGEVSLRLWFILDRKPGSVAEARRLATEGGAVAVDLTMYDAARPIYTAAPIVEGGPDPIPTRWALLDGEPIVIVPEVSAVDSLFTHRPNVSGDGWEAPDVSGVEDTEPPEWLDEACWRHVARMGYGPGQNGIHNPMRALTLLAVQLHGPEGFPAPEMFEYCCRLIDVRDTKGEAVSRKEDARRLLSGALEIVTAERAAELVETPTHPLPTFDADMAGEEVGRLIGEWLARLPGLTGPAEGMLTASLGVGKTRQLVTKLAAWVELTGKRALVRVPTHELAAQLKADFDEIGLDLAGVHHGMTRPDPFGGGPMCPRHEDVTIARKAGGDMRAICGSPKRGLCPHHPANANGERPCGYLHQNNRDKPIVIVAGDVSLGNAPPASIQRRGLEKDKGKADWQVLDAEEEAEPLKRRHFDLVILDETSPTAMLVGGPEAPVSVGLDALNPQRLIDIAVECGAPRPDFQTENELRAGLAHIRDALGEEPGPVAAAPFDIRTVAETRKLLWRLAVDVTGPASGLTGEGLAEALKGPARINSEVRRLAHLCSAILQGLEDGQRAIPQVEILSRDAEGGVRLVADLLTRQRISPAYRQETITEVDGFKFKTTTLSDPVHTFILDATGSPEPLRKFWSGLQLIGDVRAKDGPGAERFQLLDNAMAYRRVVPGARGGELHLQQEEAAGLTVLSALRVTQRPGSPGLIGPKRTMDHLKEGELLPDGTITGHFGNIRGLNTMEDASSLIVASRPALMPGQLERMAAVLFGEEITPEPSRATNGQRIVGSRSRIATMKDGTGRKVEGAAYADERAEVVRRMISAHEVDQAEGRARAVRRGEDRPVVIDILTNEAVSGAITGFYTFAEYHAATGWIGRLLIAGLWVTGKGRAQVLAEALSTPPIPYRDTKETEGLSSDPAKWLENQLKTSNLIGRARRKLFAELDAGFLSGRDPMVLGLPFPIAEWSPVSVRLSSAIYAPTAFLRAESPKATLTRAAELWPEAALNIPSKKR